jgi:hypothetical protein
VQEQDESPLERLDVMKRHLEMLEEDLEHLREDLVRGEPPKK